MKWIPLLIATLLITSCVKEEVSMPIDLEVVDTETYFPTLSGEDWDSTSPEELDWDTSKLEELYQFLEEHNTRAFIILKGGKIVSEQYWGENFDNSAAFTASSNWYWASAAKTITACITGIAQEQGKLNINDKTSAYLGEGWTSMPKEKEDLITIRHQLTMTTGMNYLTPDINCHNPECLDYRADAGTQWFYHNATYTLLDQVVENATGENYNAYSDSVLESKIGMTGTWLKLGFLNLYWSTARDAARFGHLVLNEGQWQDTKVIKDETFYKEMVSSSQDLNPSYGYLWWLNGKSSVVFPGTEIALPIELSESAPADLIGALGKNGQYIDVVPSLDLVVVRMGLAPDDALVPVQFHDDMWKKLMEVF